MVVVVVVFWRASKVSCPYSRFLLMTGVTSVVVTAVVVTTVVTTVVTGTVVTAVVVTVFERGFLPSPPTRELAAPWQTAALPSFIWEERRQD